MSQVVTFIMGLIIGGVGVGVWFRNKQEGDKKEILALNKEKEEQGAAFAKATASQSALEEYNKKMQEKKEQAKAKVLEEIKSKGSVDAGKVAELCGVSRISAFRYLEELEKEGKIEQVGSFGRAVEYKLK